MTDEKIAAVLKGVQDARDKGVTGLKIELEAHLGRGNSRSGSSDLYVDDCDDCDEDGIYTCNSCDGRGCSYGYDDGSGHWTCRNCHGRQRPTDGTSHDPTNFGSDRDCLRWILTRVAEKTNTSFTSSNVTDSYKTNPLPWMKFAKFYNDGSVDSELTFTVPLTDENILHVPKVLEAFKEMADAVNPNFDVRGAGMHMAFIFSKSCVYPSEYDDYTKSVYSSSRRLPERQLANFQRSMTQLLPALYFLASTDETSRALRYRMPIISVDATNGPYLGNGPKYSAVTYRLGAFEFRIFDTCYRDPEIVLDNFVVMANCMAYLSDEYKSPGLEKLAKTIHFGTDYNNMLERFYSTTAHIDVLNNGLKKIKPSYLTLKQIKQQRKFTKTKELVKDLDEQFKVDAEKAYKEYDDRYQWQLKHTELYSKSLFIEQAIAQMSAEEIAALTEAKLERLVAAKVKSDMAERRKKQKVKAKFMEEAVEKFNRERVGQYTLNFT